MKNLEARAAQKQKKQQLHKQILGGSVAQVEEALRQQRQQQQIHRQEQAEAKTTQTSYIADPSSREGA